MGKKDIIVAVHKAENREDSDYNILSSFSDGLLNGFRQIGIKAYTTQECNADKIPFNIAIGFDNAGIEHWQHILSNNITNIMWSSNSVFAKNFDTIKQFVSFDKFIVFETTPADKQALTKYLPELKHGYIPQAVDLDLWKNMHEKKEIDIVYFSPMIDIEGKLKELKETMPELVFNLMMQIYELTMKNPNHTFWQIASAVTDSYGLTIDIEQYLLLFKNISELAMYEQKAQMIQKLSDFDVRIYGSGPWEKYIKGNVKYMGQCSVEESIDIMNKSKISLYCHPMQQGLGIHQTILNASAAGTFSLVSDSPSIKAEFTDSLGYFNHSSFEDIADKAAYYLTNEDERIKMTDKAFDITKERHTWACRAKSIMEIVD